jgi:hypothetical protein
MISTSLCRTLTTTQTILQEGALLLIKAVKKSNRLGKAGRLMEAVIYEGGQEMHASKNGFIEAVTLRQPPPKMAYFRRQSS